MDEPQRSFATDAELHRYKGAEGKSGQFTQLSGQLTYLSMQGRSILSRKDPAFAITHPLNPMPALLLGGTRQRHHLKPHLASAGANSGTQQARHRRELVLLPSGLIRRGSAQSHQSVLEFLHEHAMTLKQSCWVVTAQTPELVTFF